MAVRRLLPDGTDLPNDLLLMEGRPFHFSSAKTPTVSLPPFLYRQCDSDNTHIVARLLLLLYRVVSRSGSYR